MSQLSRNVVIAIATASSMLMGTVAQADTGNRRKTDGGTNNPAFHHAYYLENARADYAAAAELYEKAIKSKKLDSNARRAAEARLAICQEEIASEDFARLMPSNAFAYVELSRPGQQVERLLGMLGILADENGAMTDRPRVAVSPELVRALLGIRGAAVAITGVNPQKGAPEGVLVFHPGEIDLIRGFIETALPIGGESVEAISGFATYRIENEVFVTLTNRLVIASPDRKLIEGVVARLTGQSSDSLAANEAVRGLLSDRADALLSFFVRTEPIMPMISQLLAEAAKHDPGVAMVTTLLDVQSLRSLSGRIGVTDSGVSLAVALQLDENHRNLIYNFLRTPAIDSDMLALIPTGAAAFLVGSLNDSTSRYSPSGPADSEGKPVVTALDIGREFFANIAGIAIFALPPEQNGSAAGPPMPDVAAVISVNDASKSEAIWGQLLGIVGMLGGAQAIEGEQTTVAGMAVRQFTLKDHVRLFLATTDNHVIIATSESAMNRAVRTQKGGPSIRDDKLWANHLQQINDTSTKAFFVNPGRCAQIARSFMSPEERSEIEPFIALLEHTVASFVLEHSDNSLRASLTVSGIPKIGHLIDELITEERRQGKQRHELKHAMRSEQWDVALATVDGMIAQSPDDASLLREKFHILAVGLRDEHKANQYAEGILEHANDDAKALNNFAWALLTEDDYKDRFNEVALKLSQRSNDVQKDNWMFLDTLALAKFANGDAEGAVQAEENAIRLAGGGNTSELEEALARFQEGTE